MSTIENFIEAQEAAGQRALCRSSVLPKDTGGYRPVFEGMGIKFGEDVDDLFVAVELPEGWRIERTSHSRWSNLLDHKGRKRAVIFYKAAFYDRKAHVSPTRRFSYTVRPIGGYAGDYQTREREAVVFDGEAVCWTASERLAPEPPFDHKNRKPWDEWRKQEESLGEQCGEWLQKHYPDWQNPAAYWD